MFKIKFIESNIEEKVIFKFYDDFTRIPLEIFFSKTTEIKKGKSRDNLSNNSFIEFKFNKLTLELDVISFVSLKYSQLLEDIKKEKFTSVSWYKMYLDDMINEEFLRYNYDTNIYLVNSAMLIQFGNFDKDVLNYYSLNHRLSIGVNKYMELKSLFIDDIQQNEIELLF